VIYFLGIYLHYLHVMTIFHLLDRFEEMNKNKAILLSIFWPYQVVVTVLEGLFGFDEEDKEND
jgi:hypothetical protein